MTGPSSVVAGYPFSEGFARVARYRSPIEAEIYGREDVFPARYGFIDKSGAIAISFDYHDAGDFSEGLAPVATLKNQKISYGFIDYRGNLVIQSRFESALGFSEGLAAVEVDGKWGFIDHTGNFAIEPKFPRVKSFKEGLAFVEKEVTKWVVIDRKGNQKLELSGGLTPPFSEGVTVVDGGEWIRFDGVPVRPLNDASIESYERFSEGLIGSILPTEESIGSSPKGFADHSGQLVIPGPYEKNYEFSEGLAAVKFHEKWGFVNARGQVVISCRFDDPNYNLPAPPIVFSEGLCFIGGGYIDRNGDTVISFPK